MNFLSRRIEAARLHQDAIWKVGVNELEVARVNGKSLELTDGTALTEFLSCSYLGLDQRADLREAASSAIDLFGVQMSASRSRMRPKIFGELDETLTLVFKGYHPVVFNSVSSAHLATLPVLASGELPEYTLARNGPAFVIDTYAHASMQILRGLLEQFGPVSRVNFAGLSDLDHECKRIVASGRTPILICDSVGSMGGLTDVHAVSRIADESQGIAYFDDAHGTSVFGRQGEGYVLQIAGDMPGRFIVAGSLSKGFGATGGFVALREEESASFIKRYAVPYVFGGPPSLPAMGAALASAQLHLNGSVVALQERLRFNLTLLDSRLRAGAINQGALSPIRGVRVGSEFKAIRVAQKLRRDGFAVTAAMYPTVGVGNALIRLAVTASHSDAEIQGVAEAINNTLDDLEDSS